MSLVRHLIPLIAVAMIAFGGSAPVSAAPLDFVGSYDPGTPGMNASAAGLDGIAYLGSWGSSSNCPGLGVRVIDVRDPTAPVFLATAAAYPRTTAEHVVARRLDTPWFSGNVLLVGIQRCRAGIQAPAGLAIWDVSDPSNPHEVGFASVGASVRGVHEFTVARQGDRWLAFLAVPNSEQSDGRGDLRIVDFTNPAEPVEIANWGASRDAGIPVGAGAQCAPDCRGSIPQSFLHSVTVSPDGRTAYLSYWDGGLILLDVSSPTSARFLGRWTEPRSAEGNTHSVGLAPARGLAFVTDETFDPPWGRVHVVDVFDPASPYEVGSFATEHSAAGTPGGPETWYSVHNALVDDRDPERAYLAWYADGVRLVDTRDPAGIFELALWVPPTDPQVWSVALMDDLVVVGDVNGGLYLLRR